MTTRSVESHESTIKYFRTLGWTINYDVYLRFDEDSVEYDSVYNAFACRPSAEEYGFVGHFESYALSDTPSYTSANVNHNPS